MISKARQAEALSVSVRRDPPKLRLLPGVAAYIRQIYGLR